MKFMKSSCNLSLKPIDWIHQLTIYIYIYMCVYIYIYWYVFHGSMTPWSADACGSGKADTNIETFAKPKSSSTFCRWRQAAPRQLTCSVHVSRNKLPKQNIYIYIYLPYMNKLNKVYNWNLPSTLRCVGSPQVGSYSNPSTFPKKEAGSTTSWVSPQTSRPQYTAEARRRKAHLPPLGVWSSHLPVECLGSLNASRVDGLKGNTWKYYNLLVAETYDTFKMSF